jgi:hypothetical protein
MKRATFKFGIAVAILAGSSIASLGQLLQDSQLPYKTERPQLLPEPDPRPPLPMTAPVQPARPLPPPALVPQPAVRTPTPAPTSLKPASPPVIPKFEQPPSTQGAALSAQSCSKMANRVFVEHEYGSECIEYFIAKGNVSPHLAIFNFHGDFIPEYFKAPNYIASWSKEFNSRAGVSARRSGITTIYVARPGILNSTGDHNYRRHHKELHSMNIAINEIKKRLGIRQIALSGQSGGGTIVGSLLAMGRDDVVCAAPGSGAFDVVGLQRLRSTFDGKPMTENQLAVFGARRFNKISNDTKRRIFVVGDPRDRNTFFEQQRDFAYRVKAAGHHVQLIYAPGSGEKRHGVAEVADQIAGMCLRGQSDDTIEQAMNDWWRRAFATAAPAGKGGTGKPGQYSNSELVPPVPMTFEIPVVPVTPAPTPAQ